MADVFRPQTFAELVGQSELKNRLQVHIDAAMVRHDMLDHVFLSGPAGFGKTSVAALIAHAVGQPFESVTMPIAHASLIRLVQEFDGVLLLDEIHRGSQRQQEELLPLLEFGQLRTNRGIPVEAGNITIVGATTEPAKVIIPLRDRFPIRPDFVDYTDEEMARIVAGMAVKAGLDLPHSTAVELGRATGGTPRNARQFVLIVRDLSLTEGVMPSATDVLELCKVSSDGLTALHKDYLYALRKSGGPMGLTTLATVLDQNADSVRESERLLVKMDLVRYTDRGRELSKAGLQRTRV